MSIQVVILCGGEGTRLWPLSNIKQPKQLIELHEQYNLLDYTIERVNNITSIKPLLVTSTKYPLPSRYNNYPQLIEPYSNDTGVAFARIAQHYQHDNVILLIIPCDHYISNITNFTTDVSKAWREYRNGITLFGILPTEPHTGYGYILKRDIIHFYEKPDINKAKFLINQGAVWNSGMVLVDNKELYSTIPDDLYNIQDDKKYPSFDVAVLQKYTKLKLFCTSDWQWSDVGTWNQLLPLLDDKTQGKIVTVQCDNTTIINPGTCEVIAIGLSNLMIVCTDNKILISSKSADNSLLKSAISKL